MGIHNGTKAEMQGLLVMHSGETEAAARICMRIQEAACVKKTEFDRRLRLKAKSLW